MSLEPALDYVRARIQTRPKLALVLGSGLGSLVEAASGTTVLPTTDIPGYPASTVVGHAGKLVFGRLSGGDVVFLQGRLHRYEGHGLEKTTFPIRLMAAMGVRRLLLTNAAGGVNPDFKPGTLMWITSHINWSFETPTLPETARTPVYDRAWTREAIGVAEHLGIHTRQGTYAWTRGPQYETPAEVRALAALGADAVGMSTVPEALVANSLGMRVLGLSTITNAAAGLGEEPLNHEEVLETGQRVQQELQRLVMGVVA